VNPSVKKTSSRVPELIARFVEAYFAQRENATQAYLAIKPHVTINTAAVEGHKLLSKPKTQELVEKRRAQLRSRYALSAERVYEELGRLSYFTPKKLLHEDGRQKMLHELDDDTAAALSAIETETSKDGVLITRYRAHDKNSALEKVIKILRLNERPPPTPPDPSDGRPTDMRDTTRRLLFMLHKEAAENASTPKLARPKKKVAAEA
jgi:phage terminase small subunit